MVAFDARSGLTQLLYLRRFFFHFTVSVAMLVTSHHATHHIQRNSPLTSKLNKGWTRGGQLALQRVARAGQLNCYFFGAFFFARYQQLTAVGCDFLAGNC